MIRANHGTIDKYMGDCVMAFCAVEIADAGCFAVKCALEMVTAVRKVNEEQRAKGLPEFDVGL